MDIDGILLIIALLLFFRFGKTAWYATCGSMEKSHNLYRKRSRTSGPASLCYNGYHEKEL